MYSTEVLRRTLLAVLVPVDVAIGLHTAQIIYRTRIAGRRQVTFRFMN